MRRGERRNLTLQGATCGRLAPGLLLSWSLWVAGAGAAAPEWREAILGLRTDGTGAVWNFQENGELGRIGASAVNRGQMLLVDGESFAAQGSYMSGDGNEFLFSGQAGGALESLVLVRRVKLDPEAGVVRYVELLRNTGRESRKVQVELRTNLNGYYQRFVSDRGREMPTVLEENERGFWLAPEGGREGGTGYAFVVTGREAKVRPVLGSKRSYVASAYFELEIGPGDTAALLHAIRQAPLEVGNSVRGLAEAFGLLDLDQMLRELPPAIRGRVHNVRGAGEREEATFFRSLPGVGSESDVVALRDGGVLKGQLREGSLTLETAWGRVEIQASQMRALGPVIGKEEGLQVWVKGGEVVVGRVLENTLGFVLSGGEVIVPKWEGVRYVRRRGEQEVDRTASWVRMADGAQLRLRSEGEPGKGRWVRGGDVMELDWSQIAGMEENEGLWLTLQEGSRIRVTAEEGRVGLGGLLEGRDVTAVDIRGLWRPGGGSLAEAGAGLVETVRGERLMWQDRGDKVLLETSQGRITIPLAEIRRIERRGEAFEVALWDGSQFPAKSTGGQALRVRGNWDWEVPWDDLRVLIGDTGKAGEGRRREIEMALEELGAADWMTRDAAEKRLREMGIMALPWLREAQKRGDTEVRHRVSLILAEMEEGDEEGLR